MTLRHLQIFKMVCECGGITSAAEKLNMTQPSVSIAIKELEAYYQTVLFDRMNRGIYITQSGEVLLGYTNEVLTAFNESVVTLRENNNFTRCRLGVNMAIAESVLPELLCIIYKRIPDIQLNLTVENSIDIESKLLSNQIDFSIVDRLTENPNTKSTFLFKESMSVLCGKYFETNKKISIYELSHQPLFLREKQSGNRQCVDAVFLKHGYMVSPIVESKSTQFLISLAKKQLGYIFLPKSLALKECLSGELQQVSIEDDEFLRHYFLVRNNHKHITPIMKLVQNIILSFFKEKEKYMNFE